MNSGKAVKLSGDVTLLESSLTVGEDEDVTLDLCGHTLTSGEARVLARATHSGLIVNAGGTLTIKNGTIKYTVGGENDAAVANKGVLYLENVNIESNARCLLNWGDDAKVAEWTTSDVKAYVTGGTMTCNINGTSYLYAVHGYCKSELYMDGVTVKGNRGGVSVDACRAELKNVVATDDVTGGSTYNLYVASGIAKVTGCQFTVAKAYADSTWGCATVNDLKYSNTGDQDITNLN